MQKLVLQEPNHIGGKMISFTIIRVMIVTKAVVIFAPMSPSYINHSI